MTRIECTAAEARCLERDVLTSGMVGAQCAFIFSSEWDDMDSKIAVFIQHGHKYAVEIPLTNKVLIPKEVLTDAGYTLTIGIYGNKLNGTTVVTAIPTIYCNAGEVKVGASTTGSDNPGTATATLVDQMAAYAQAAAQSASDAADDAEDALTIAGQARTTANTANNTANAAKSATDSFQAALNQRVKTVNNIAPDANGNVNVSGGGGGGSYDDTELRNRIGAIETQESTWNAKYSKPADGIPKTDLVAAVRASLDKADSAVQTESDPVFSASAASGISSANITSWHGKYTKPSVGIPWSDLAADVTTNVNTLINTALGVIENGSY